MEFTLQNGGGANIVTACTATEIRVGDTVIRSSAILSADRLVLDWPPRRVETLAAADLQAVLALKPDIILLGTGERQVFPPREVLAVVQKTGVALEVMDTRAACRTYNVLVQEGRRVAAAVLVG